MAGEYDFVQAIARREIGAILASGESLIYDDLLLEREDRRKLAAVAEAHWAGLVLVYLDTPLPVIDERRAANSGTRRRASIPEASMRLDISVLEPPQRCRTGHLRQPGLRPGGRPGQGQRSPHGKLNLPGPAPTADQAASWKTRASVCRWPDLIADTPWRTGAADQPRAERTGRSLVVNRYP